MSQNPKPKQEEPIKMLVLDTNVILYSLSENEDLAYKSKAYLIALIEKGYLLCINEITLYECYKKLKPDRTQAFNDFLKIFKQYYIDKQTLLLAADLSSFYSQNEHIKPIFNKIATEDILIA